MNVLKTLIVVFSLLVISLPSSAVAKCNIFDQFDNPFDTFTKRKDCDEYCEAREPLMERSNGIGKPNTLEITLSKQTNVI